MCVLVLTQCGLASLILSILAPLQGVISFRKLGIIQKFPERLQPSIKALHRSVRTTQH